MAASGTAIRPAVDLDNLIQEYTYFEKVNGEVYFLLKLWSTMRRNKVYLEFIVMQCDDIDNPFSCERERGVFQGEVVG